jgi:hypothetical protein
VTDHDPAELDHQDPDAAELEDDPAPVAELPAAGATSAPWSPGTPDASGTTLSVAEVCARFAVSDTTVRRRLRTGTIPGAHQAPGPFGTEWRIPVAGAEEAFRTGPAHRPPVELDHADPAEVDRLRAELEDARRRAEVAEELAEQRARDADRLRDALAAMTRALPAGDDYRGELDRLRAEVAELRTTPPPPVAVVAPVVDTPPRRRWWRR